LDLLQPALEALKQSGALQQAGIPSYTPQRANVLLRPLAAGQTEQAQQDTAAATPAFQAAADASKAAVQPTPATAGMLPTPLLMTPAGALLQTPASAAAWAANPAATLGLPPAVQAMAGAGVRPAAAFPHFLSGMMATPLLQQTRPVRPGSEAQQAAEADDGKLSKKRQGYHVEPAALQKLIEKQQIEAARKYQQEQQAAAAAAAAKAAAASGDRPDEPPPRQQQQHRPRVLSRLPPQVREQAERQAAERARKQQQQQQEQEEGAGDNTADGSGSSRAPAVVGGAFTHAAQQPMTAADCLESPNASIAGLRLPVGDLSTMDSQGGELNMELEAGKLFGSAQKRLRLSLCDENGSLLPGGQSLMSPVVLPTPSPALAAHTPAPAVTGTGVTAAAAGGSSAAAGPGAGGVVVPSQEAPTPSKFFSGSPVPQTERRAVIQRAPDTPVALGTGPPPHRLEPQLQEALLEPLRAGAAGPEGGHTGTAEQGSGSSWVPVPGQAPAVLGSGPVPTAPPAAAAGVGEGPGDSMVLDAAAAAAMPVPESPEKQVAVVGEQAQGGGGAGGSGGGEGSLVLQTPQGQEQAVAATPITGL
jgi:hypothetical protein